MTAIADYVNLHQERFVQELREIVRIPSVSTEPQHKEDVQRAAEWVRDCFRKIDVPAKILATKGHPAVFAELNADGDAPTVLIYGHYDVQPAQREDGWTREPFGAEVDGDILYGRGSADNKGQFMAHIKGLETYRKAVGEPRLHIRFLIEGEEEIASPHLGDLIRAKRDDLRPDVIVISDTSMFRKDIPTISYGLRGLAAVEVTVRGANRDLHSGSYGGAVVNPLHVLSEVLAALHDKEGRVAIPGFYDDVEPLEAWERQAWVDLPWSDEEYRRDLGLDSLWGEPGYSTLERCWGRPTLEINGIWGGFTGHGAKTVIPRRASAKITCRLVPNQNPTKIVDQLESFIKSLPLNGSQVEIIRQSTGRPVGFKTSGPWMGALKRALKEAFGREPVFIREGGSIPIVSLLQEEFRVPILLAGFARPDCGAHGPDEYFSLTDYERAIRTAAILLRELDKSREGIT